MVDRWQETLSKCVTMGALYYSGCAGTEWKGLRKSLMFHERNLLFLNTTIKFFFCHRVMRSIVFLYKRVPGRDPL